MFKTGIFQQLAFMKEKWSFINTFSWTGLLLFTLAMWLAVNFINLQPIPEGGKVLRAVLVAASFVHAFTVILLWIFIFVPSRVSRFISREDNVEAEICRTVLGVNITLWLLISGIPFYSFMGRILGFAGKEVHLLFSIAVLLLLITRRTGKSYLKFVEQVNQKV